MVWSKSISPCWSCQGFAIEYSWLNFVNKTRAFFFSPGQPESLCCRLPSLEEIRTERYRDTSLWKIDAGSRIVNIVYRHSILLLWFVCRFGKYDEIFLWSHRKERLWVSRYVSGVEVSIELNANLFPHLMICSESHHCRATKDIKKLLEIWQQSN